MTPLGRVDEPHRIHTEALDELRATGVWLGGDLDHRLSDRQLRTRGHIRDAEIEIDEQLIAGQMPAALVLRDECHNPRVHQVELHVWMRAAVGGPPAAAMPPTIADETVDEIELPFGENFPLPPLRPPNDHLQHAIVGRRSIDLIEPRLEL